MTEITVALIVLVAIAVFFWFFLPLLLSYKKETKGRN